MSDCTSFITHDWDEGLATWRTLCRCPACRAFLPRDFPVGEQFQCRKCGQVLETLPATPEDDEEEDTDYEWGGKICKVPHYAVKIVKVDYPKLRRPRKKKTGKWAFFLNFSRRVWKDRAGEFIKVGRERIPLDDPRIVNVTEEESR